MKKLLILIATFCLGFMVYAHNPQYTLLDLKTGRVMLWAQFPDYPEWKTEGGTVYILKDKPYNGPKDSIDGKLILEAVPINADGIAIFYKPNTKHWRIFLDLGAGHQFFKENVGMERLDETPFMLKDKEKEIWKGFLDKDKTLTPEQKELIEAGK